MNVTSEFQERLFTAQLLKHGSQVDTLEPFDLSESSPSPETSFCRISFSFNIYIYLFGSPRSYLLHVNSYLWYVTSLNSSLAKDQTWLPVL